jgi:hypothetical protein
MLSVHFLFGHKGTKRDGEGTCVRLSQCTRRSARQALLRSPTGMDLAYG